MILTQLKSGDLKQILRLLEQREALQAQVETIDGQLAAFESGQSSAGPVAPSKPEVAPRPPGKRKLSAEGRARISAAAKARWARVKRAAAPKAALKPARRASGGRRMRGQLKEQIIGMVKGAGKAGITVKEIAAKLGDKPDRIHVWFNATGKNVKEIKRVRPATYAWAA